MGKNTDPIMIGPSNLEGCEELVAELGRDIRRSLYERERGTVVASVRIGPLKLEWRRRKRR